MRKLELCIAFILCTTFTFAQSVSGCNGTTGTPIQAGVSTTTFTDSNVANGATLHYSVKAVDVLGNSSICSNIVTVSIPISGAHSVTLTWLASSTSNVTYSIFRTPDPSPPSNLQATVN